MAGDFLNTYKYGWKTSYYQNTYDSKTDIDTDDTNEEPKSAEDLVQDILNQEQEGEACDSCAI